MKKVYTHLHTPAYPGGEKGVHAPHGSEAKTVKSACFWLIFIQFCHLAPRSTPFSWHPAYVSDISYVLSLSSLTYLLLNSKLLQLNFFFKNKFVCNFTYQRKWLFMCKIQTFDIGSKELDTHTNIFRKQTSSINSTGIVTVLLCHSTFLGKFQIINNLTTTDLLPILLCNYWIPFS